MEEIIKEHPYLVEYGYLIKRSENCVDKYKWRFIFYQMQLLAVKYNIDICGAGDGVERHGKGLIDVVQGVVGKFLNLVNSEM